VAALPAPIGGLVSRRAVLAGGLGAGALAAIGVPMWGYVRSRPSGRLVGDLLDARPFYIAHRGGSADWPEQSMLAYRSAVACGVDALEVSLARSADGVWFGLHDASLDRTSGTTGFRAADHDWAQIQAHRIAAPAGLEGAPEPQPYLRFEELVDTFAGTHTIFVDPKAVAPVHFPELLKIMASAGPRPAERFLAKYYCTGTEWARVAHAAGYRTWGFYYGHQVDDGSTPPAATQASWDLLGLDVEGSAAAWAAVRGYRKPIIGHVVTDRAGARTALDRGAQGLMVAAVRAVLGS
jgi:Glycerophosphoryl diester phosphodiesterase family